MVPNVIADLPIYNLRSQIYNPILGFPVGSGLQALSPPLLTGWPNYNPSYRGEDISVI